MSGEEASEAFDHALDLRWMGAHREYRPDCICGWTGSYTGSRSVAEFEYERHAAGTP